MKGLYVAFLRAYRRRLMTGILNSYVQDADRAQIDRLNALTALIARMEVK